jgi:hypothetical protein
MVLALTHCTEHKMTEFKIVHDVQTGLITEVPLTDKEIKELEKLRAQAIKEQSLDNEA